MPWSGGRPTTGGSFSEGMTGGRTSTGGSVATGGRTLSGGTATIGGRSAGGAGGIDTIPWSGGRTSTGGAGVGGMVVDMAPMTGGRTSTGGAGMGGMFVDTVPRTGGRSAVSVGGMVSDPVAPVTGGKGTTGGAGITAANAFSAEGLVNSEFFTPVSVKPVAERDAALVCAVDPAPPECTSGALRSPAVVENWRDSSPKRFVRSNDLALSDPPDVKLDAELQGLHIRVRLSSSITGLSYRWESEGHVKGEGREVLWTPAHDDDALRVAVRSSGGITVATLRATDVGRG